MTFDEKELEMLISKKVDRIIFYSEEKPVLDVPLGKMVKDLYNADINLQKQLLKRALESAD